MDLTICATQKCKILNRQGGRQTAKFLDRDWVFTVQTDDSEQDSKITEDLREENKQLKQELSCLSRLSTLKQSRGTEYYSERHLRRLKKVRAETCNASWLKDEGR